MSCKLINVFPSPHWLIWRNWPTHYCFTLLGDAVWHLQVKGNLQVLPSAFHLSLLPAHINGRQLKTGSHGMYRLGTTCRENCTLSNVILFVSVTKLFSVLERVLFSISLLMKFSTVPTPLPRHLPPVCCYHLPLDRSFLSWISLTPRFYTCELLFFFFNFKSTFMYFDSNLS